MHERHTHTEIDTTHKTTRQIKTIRNHNIQKQKISNVKSDQIKKFESKKNRNYKNIIECILCCSTARCVADLKCNFYTQ